MSRRLMALDPPAADLVISLAGEGAVHGRYTKVQRCGNGYYFKG